VEVLTEEKIDEAEVLEEIPLIEEAEVLEEIPLIEEAGAREEVREVLQEAEDIVHLGEDQMTEGTMAEDAQIQETEIATDPEVKIEIDRGAEKENLIYV
jgi:hypothetical protein